MSLSTNMMTSPNSVKLSYHSVDGKKKPNNHPQPQDDINYNPNWVSNCDVYIMTGVGVLLWLVLCVVFNCVAIGTAGKITGEEGVSGAIMTLGIVGLISAVLSPHTSWIIGIVAFTWAMIKKDD